MPWRPVLQAVDQRLLLAFAEQDFNGSGELDRDEMRKVVQGTMEAGTVGQALGAGREHEDAPLLQGALTMPLMLLQRRWSSAMRPCT